MRFLVSILAAWLLIAAGQAAAHAVLLETAPAEGARLTDAPRSAALRFNEPVTPAAIRLVGPGIQQELVARAENDRIVVDLPVDLKAGGYYLVWRVASADTHPIAGTISFAIGDAALPVPPPDSGAHAFDPRTPIAMFVRFARDLALAIGVGGLAFLAFVNAGSREGPRRAIRAALFVAFAAAALSPAMAGARIADLAPWTAQAWRAGWHSSAGPAAIAMLISIALAFVPKRIAAFGALILAGLGTALTGHATAGGMPIQAVQTLHSVAALFWLGAFVPLFHAVRNSPVTAAHWGTAFSPAGIAAVVIVAVSAMWLGVPRLEGELGRYAALMAIKAALFAGLIAIAAHNRQRAVPQAKAGDPAALGRNLKLDLAFGLALVGATAMLTHTPPAVHLHGQGGHDHDHAQTHAPRSGLSLIATQANRMLWIEASGTRLEMRLLDASNAPVAPKEFEIELKSSAAGIEGLRRQPAILGPGYYGIDEAALALPGPWTLRAEALIDDFTKVIFEIELR
ncbi:MAG: copper resistance protein CopC [Alphaproteobacteria bacterium]|nr:copper resistance protein CopC [Alphaproteobacteria bacterium]